MNNFFSYVETGLPRLNQYYAEGKVSCSRTQWRVPLVRLEPATHQSQVKHILPLSYRVSLVCKKAEYHLTLYPKETLFDAFANRTDPDQAALNGLNLC